MMKYLN